MSESGLDQQRIRQLTDRLRVKPGTAMKLPKDLDPAFTGGLGHERADEAQAMLAQGVELLAEYQDRLAAQETHAVLVIIQGMDGAGKDSTIKHVLSGVNPQGVEVHSFKVPSTDELNHDYLWRYAQRLPPRGKIGIFNRSHYEEVLVVRVHPELLNPQHLPQKTGGRGIWRQRFDEINDWEHYLADNGIHVIKLFLNISREEQRRRFLARIEQPDKNWKFTAADVHERTYWDDYQRAYAEVLTNTSTEWAPWHAIPADHKWFTHIAAAAIIAQTLITIDPRYPTIDPHAKKELDVARRDLLAEAPPGA